MRLYTRRSSVPSKHFKEMIFKLSFDLCMDNYGKEKEGSHFIQEEGTM